MNVAAQRSAEEAETRINFYVVSLMNTMYLPTVGPQDWQKLLADPEKQWRTGYSARTIAYAWGAAKGHFPGEGASLLFARAVSHAEKVFHVFHFALHDSLRSTERGGDFDWLKMLEPQIAITYPTGVNSVLRKAYM